MRRGAALVAALLLAGCHAPAADDSARDPDARGFPPAGRPVAGVSPGYSTEAERDRAGEAAAVMALAGIAPGMSVADIGAGAGYYTVRLARQVGGKGRVLAEDIDTAALVRLGDRVARERLDNVSIAPGRPADPRLPAASFDRVLLVHMYHEVAEPYAFLWHLRAALRPTGAVVVVDDARPPAAHGMPPAMLFCEFEALGFRLSEFARKPELRGYYARFDAVGTGPAPAAIRPCHQGGKPADHGERD